jgi:hypothetical protein
MVNTPIARKALLQVVPDASRHRGFVAFAWQRQMKRVVLNLRNLKKPEIARYIEERPVGQTRLGLEVDDTHSLGMLP